MRFTYLLFDWDNTLVESWQTIYQAWLATLKHYAKPPLSMEEVQFLARKSARDSFPSIFGKDYQEAISIYRQHFQALRDTPKPLEGALNLLQYLQNHSIPCGLISNKGDALLHREVSMMKFHDYFPLGILGADKAPKDKPDLLAYTYFFDQYGKTPSGQGAYVGDTGIDISFAQNTRLCSVFIGNNTVEGDPTADLQFSNLTDFRNYLKNAS